MVRGKRALGFALLVVLAEIAGRSITARIDRALHVEPLANSAAGYYPFLLVGVKVVGALLLAGLLARLMRAHAAARAGDRLLLRLGHAHERAVPRLRPRLSPRIWSLSFVATSLLYLGDGAAEGFSPWLHTYALPVYAALSVVVALAWSLAHWVRAVEEYGEHALARVRRLLHGLLDAARPRPARPLDDLGPRRRFGLAFESRPPPLAA